MNEINRIISFRHREYINVIIVLLSYNDIFDIIGTDCSFNISPDYDMIKDKLYEFGYIDTNIIYTDKVMTEITEDTKYMIVEIPVIQRTKYITHEEWTAEVTNFFGYLMEDAPSYESIVNDTSINKLIDSNDITVTTYSNSRKILDITNIKSDYKVLSDVVCGICSGTFSCDSYYTELKNTYNNILYLLSEYGYIPYTRLDDEDIEYDAINDFLYDKLNNHIVLNSKSCKYHVNKYEFMSRKYTDKIINSTGQEVLANDALLNHTNKGVIIISTLIHMYYLKLIKLCKSDDELKQIDRIFIIRFLLTNNIYRILFNLPFKTFKKYGVISHPTHLGCISKCNMSIVQLHAIHSDLVNLHKRKKNE